MSLHDHREGADAKVPVSLMLSADVLRRARALPGDLSERIERLLAAHLAAEEAGHDDPDHRLDRAIAGWNTVDAQHGSFADDHVPF